MRVLVCGTREKLSLSQQSRVWSVLDTINVKRPIDLVIHGGAHGVDYCAAQWAKNRGVLAPSFYVSKKVWERVGRRAGPIRNRIMLELKPDIVAAFPGGIGTDDMCKAARQAGIAPSIYDWKIA